MKKFFGFGAGKGRSSPTFRTEPMNGLRARADKNEEVNKSQRGYDVRVKDLKKIHRAAAVGDVAKMQRLLLLGKDVNKRDKMKRTPLHLACTIGHADMVTLLVERKCQLNLCDRECKTPLMKAVQCQEEACVTILLEHGANPHLTDNFGNTALHYAVAGENTSIVEKLILYHANIEARNKFELTPFLLAVNENKHQMVELLIGKKADVHVVDKSKRTALMLAATSKSPDVVRLLLQQGVNTSSRDECGWTAEDYAVFGGFDVNRQIIAQHREERIKNFSQNNNPVTNKTFEEDSLSSISVKPGDDNASWPTSDDEDLSFNMKNTSKPNLRKLMNVSQRFKNLETELGLVSPQDETLFEDDNSDNKCEDTFGVPSKPSVDICDSSPPALPSPDSILKPPFTSLGLGLTKEGEEQPVIETKHDGITESVPQAQTVNDCLTSADRADKNDRHVMLSALGFAEQNEESPWDSESNSESLPEKYIDHLSGNADQKGTSPLNEQVEDSPEKYSFLKPTVEEKDSVPKKGGEMEEKQTSKSDSPGKCSYLKPAVEGKDFVPNEPGEMEEKEASKSDSPEKYFHLKPAVEGKDFIPNQPGEMEEIQACQTDSPGKYSYLKPGVEVNHSLPNKPGEMEEKETSESDFSAELDLEMTTEEEEESLSESENKHLQIEETKRHQNDEMAVLESIYASASAGLMHPIGSGKTDNNLCPITENEESDGDPALDTKELMKGEKEKQTSKESVIIPRFEKAPSLTSRPLQMNDDSTSSGMDQDEGRPAKKTSSEAEEVKKQIDSVDDLDDLTPSSETISEDFHMPCSNYMICMSLIEQHGMDCKDSVSLLKIQDMVLSYERLIELKKNHCGQLKRKNKKMENKANRLQKELSETKEVISKLELQKVEWEQELCSLRFTLKQEKERRRNAEMLYEKIQEQLIRKEEQYNKEVEMKQELELNLRTLDMELRTVKNDFNQVVEEWNDTKKQLCREQDARILQDGILNNHLCKQKEIEMDNKRSSGISNSHENEKYLLHNKYILEDQIAMLRLEIDTINNQSQEKERKYCEDIEILKEKHVSLQKTIKLNEERLTKTELQHSGQINALSIENTMLKSKLENEKQNKERLDEKVESYRARLAAAIQDYDQSQTSKRDLELAFQRAKGEWFRVQDKLNFDVSKLKEDNELLSQNLSEAESKFNTLETELHRTRDALREKTLVLERAQRDLSQTQCQKKEIEHSYQSAQDKVSKYIGKQESLKERLSQLQSENMLLQQQLDDAHNKASSKEKVVINIQDQFQDILKKLEAESQKQALVIEASKQELINERNLLRERMYVYEKEKVEREVAVRQLQEELADTLKKQSMSEASLEVTSRCRMNLEDEVQDLKKKLAQIRNQLQDAQERHAEAVTRIETLKDHVQKLEVENAELKDTITKQVEKIEQLQENTLSTCSSDDEKGQIKKFIELKQSLECSLNQEMKKNGELEKEIARFKKLLKVTRKKLSEYENEDLSFHGDLRTSHAETDIQINMLKHKVDDLTAKLETLSSKNQVLTLELSSMKEIQTKCEKLEKNKKKLEQQVVNLRSCVEVNMVEYSKIEQYKRELEERTRLNIEEKLKEVDLFLQTQVASQESLAQLRENNNASLRSQMELRIKELEFELLKMKSSQEDLTKTELDRYKHLYLEEVTHRMSLTNELNKTSERLAETSTKLLVEKQQKQTLLDTINMRPSLDLPYGRNVNNSSLFNRNVTLRENVVIPTSNSWRSSKDIGTFLTKMQQELEKNITRELEEVAAEFESGSSGGATSLESTFERHINCDDVLKSYREYSQFLKKKYTI
ncbi:ankyrin repeat domain-containing protein 26 isoform X4 [Mustela lutreola]|uniref:ankyrin repeat domain-containing protein 26 isoform X4 n=1 Tax=Mustela lutreola TaxID=9666 RepID=UPI0027973638|nr:ankyrin repeat domain-containing protein 26 isoform X4 [Mustela lutreola]